MRRIREHRAWLERELAPQRSRMHWTELASELELVLAEFEQEYRMPCAAFGPQGRMMARAPQDGPADENGHFVNAWNGHFPGRVELGPFERLPDGRLGHGARAFSPDEIQEAARRLAGRMRLLDKVFRLAQERREAAVEQVALRQESEHLARLLDQKGYELRIINQVLEDDLQRIIEANTAFQLSRQGFTHLYQSNRDGYAMLDGGLRVIGCNQRLCQMLDLGEAQARGRLLADFFAPARRPGVEDWLRGRPGHPRPPLESELEGGQGHPLPVELSHAPSLDAKAGLGEHWVFVRDLSREKETLRSLRSKERLFQVLTQNMVDLAWTTDSARRLSYLSPSCLQLRGLAPEALLGQPLERLLGAAIASDMADSRQWRGQKAVRFEGRMEREDGSSFWAESLASQLCDDNGQPEGLVGITRDESERKARLDKLEEAHQKVMAADQLKTAFLANMSHEIRTPMNAIIGFTHLLGLPGIPSGKVKHFTRLIDKNARQLLTIIEDILELSKIQSGQATVSKQECEVEPLFREALEQARQYAKLRDKEQLRLVLSLDGLPEKIFTDPERFKQIFRNLSSNAIKYTDWGTITLGARRQEADKIVFFVEDQGIGIPIDKIELIFDRFGKILDSGQSNTGGTGLGLAICKRLVNLLGGNIWAKSKPGEGSTFFFELPMAHPHERVP